MDVRRVEATGIALCALPQLCARSGQFHGVGVPVRGAGQRVASQEDGTIGTEIHSEAMVLVVAAKRPAPKHIARSVDFDDPILQGILGPTSNDVAISSWLNPVGLRQMLVDAVAAEQIAVGIEKRDVALSVHKEGVVGVLGVAIPHCQNAIVGRCQMLKSIGSAEVMRSLKNGGTG